MAERGRPYRRLLTSIASIHLLLGLSIYSMPFGYANLADQRLSRWFAAPGAVLLICGTVMLYGLVFRRWERRSALVIAVSALLNGVLAVGAWWNGSWLAVALFGLPVGAVLVAPRLKTDPTHRVFGAVLIINGTLMFTAPHLFSTPQFAFIRNILPAAATLGLLGGCSLLLGSRFRLGYLGDWPQRLLEVALPTLLALGSFSAGNASGLAIWGTVAVLMVTDGYDEPEPPDSTLRGDEGPFLPMLETRLEGGMWLLPCGIALVTVVGMRPPSPAERIFVGAALLYNVLALWRYRSAGPPTVRLRMHLSVYALLIGLLLLHGTVVGHGFLALLAMVPVLAARALGRREGYLLLLITGFAVFTSSFQDAHGTYALSQVVSEVALELLVLLVVSLFGLQLGDERHRAASALEAQKVELQRLADIVEATSDFVAISDMTGRRIYMNQAGLRLVGADLPEKVIGNHYCGTYSPETLALLHSVAAPALEREGVWNGEGSLISLNGERIPVSVVAIGHRDQHGQVVYRSCILRDIRQQKLAEQAMRDSELRFRNAFDNAPIGMSMVDMRGTFVQVNEALCWMLGYTQEELLGKQIRDVTHPDESRNALPPELIEKKLPTIQFEKRYLHKSGHVVWGQVTSTLMYDSTEASIYLLSHIQDITERKESERKLMHLANYDPLTDLFNRRRFHEELEVQIEAALKSNTVGALLFLDLDQFKYTNDSLGHQAGDQLLRGLGALLRRVIGEGIGTVARLGGDEFGVILPGTDPEQAFGVAGTILKAMREHVHMVNGETVGTTASIGIALFPEHGVTVEELVARADFAMYRAKEQGRNRAYAYRPGTGEEAQAGAKLTWERRIRAALAENRLTLYCQPIWGLKEGRQVHCEALLRMIGEDGSVIAPGEFLPVAERFGLIHDIDRWVVAEAIRILAAERGHGRTATLEVNLSARCFEDRELAPMIRQKVAEAGLNPGQLVLEITETAAISNLEAAREFICSLRAAGCRFAIDDFGAGFSSFSYLKHLSVDYLKLDGSYVKNLPREPVDQHLVRAMVEVARGLGMKTIAEFVGDAETMQLLKAYGVDYAQGYYIGRPQPQGHCKCHTSDRAQ